MSIKTKRYQLAQAALALVSSRLRVDEYPEDPHALDDLDYREGAVNDLSLELAEAFGYGPTSTAVSTRTEWCDEVARLIHANVGTVFAILLELDPSVASSRDKGLLIEAVQRLERDK